MYLKYLLYVLESVLKKIPGFFFGRITIFDFFQKWGGFFSPEHVYIFLLTQLTIYISLSSAFSEADFIILFLKVNTKEIDPFLT